jgi:hypothetical protein
MRERREKLSDSPFGVVEAAQLSEEARPVVVEALAGEFVLFVDDVIEGGRRLYSYDGQIPATLFVTDEVALVWGVTGALRRRVLFSENETGQLWALDVVERYRERPEAVEPQAFT